ncbi:MAG: hypothetical protein NOU37_08525 [Candidatus Brocadiales bacterium]|nr:hypothetical protein [Candidatus Bathyanammoxibius amoris]
MKNNIEENSKIAQWVDKLLRACSDSEDAAGIVEELTSGPVTFTEEDFAEHMKIHHPGVSARVELEDGFLNLHAGFSIFSLTFVCTAEADPSGKMAYVRQEKGPALKNFLDIVGMCDRTEFLSYDDSRRSVSLDLSKIPEDVNVVAFEIKKGCVVVELRKEVSNSLA